MSRMYEVAFTEPEAELLTSVHGHVMHNVEFRWIIISRSGEGHSRSAQILNGSRGLFFSIDQDRQGKVGQVQEV